MKPTTTSAKAPAEAKTATPAGPAPAYPGICGTCNFAPTCTYLARSPHQVIWECEQFDDQETPRVDHIVEEHAGRRGAIMAVLEEIQAKYGYLPRKALEAVAASMGVSMVDIYGVATFYKSFTLHPRGKHLVSVCLGTACHVRGGAAVAAEFERKLGIRPGETSDDLEFSFETVNCLGACAIGPIVVVDGRYFSKVTKATVPGIIAKAREGLAGGELPTDGSAFPLDVSCSHCNRSLMDPEHPLDGYPSIRVTAACGGQHGWLRLSSVYGSYNVESEHAFPMGAVVDFFCPHCHAELPGGGVCVECGAPVVPLMVRGGGMVQICTRQGCRHHMLDLSGVNV